MGCAHALDVVDGNGAHPVNLPGLKCHEHSLRVMDDAVTNELDVGLVAGPEVVWVTLKHYELPGDPLSKEVGTGADRGAAAGMLA